MLVTKLSVPLVMVGSLLAVAAGATKLHYAAIARIETTEVSQKTTVEDVQKLREQREGLSIQVTRLETKMDQVVKVLERIERKLSR